MREKSKKKVFVDERKTIDREGKRGWEGMGGKEREKVTKKMKKERVENALDTFCVNWNRKTISM